MSQETDILNFMKEGNAINPMIALNKFGCFRLSARIMDLKKKDIKVISEMVDTYNGKRYKEYWIVPN